MDPIKIKLPAEFAKEITSRLNAVKLVEKRMSSLIIELMQKEAELQKETWQDLYDYLETHHNMELDDGRKVSVNHRSGVVTIFPKDEESKSE